MSRVWRCVLESVMLSIADMGVLRVEVIGGKNLMAGDRSGKSDVSVQCRSAERQLLTGLAIRLLQPERQQGLQVGNEEKVRGPIRIAGAFPRYADLT